MLNGSKKYKKLKQSLYKKFNMKMQHNNLKAIFLQVNFQQNDIGLL